MALKDLISDLSNFKGQSQYDGLDSQIKNGVDFIPNTDAPGFTPKTDLESLYNKVKNGTVVAPNSGVVNNEKSRNAYGAGGEYLEPAGIGMSSTNHILSSDNVLGVRIQPKFTSEFMTTPIASYVSMFNPPVNESLTLTVARVNASGNFTFNNTHKVPNARGSDFMTTPLANFVSEFQKPYNSDVYNVQQHISSGPTQFNIQPFDNTPSVPNAHGGDFMTTPIASYDSMFSLSTPLGAGSKTLSVRKEAFRQSSEAGVSNTDVFTKPFSVDTMKSTYNDSSYIDDLLKFDKKGKNTYPNVPSGINDEGNFGTANFRKVASKGPFSGNDNQPFILRGIGNKWGIDANDGLLQTLDQVAGGFVRGAPGITGLVDRSLQDKLRIGRFMFTTNLGLTFIIKQFALQALNPTLESKIWNPASALSLTGVGQIISGLVSAAQGGGLPTTSQLLQAARSAAISAAFPIGHPERHLGGIKYQDVNPLNRLEEDKGLGKKIKSIPVVGNTLFDKINEKIDEVGGFSRLGSQANMEFKVAGRTESLKLKDRLLLMNPNKYLFPFSSAPMSVVDGVPKFTIEAGSGDGSAAKADADKATDEYKVGQTQGGVTFNKSMATKHSTLEYDRLNSDNKYESKLLSAGELNRRDRRVSDEVPAYERQLKDERDYKKDINTDIGVYNGNEPISNHPVLKTIKGTMLSSNVDKVNMTPYGADAKNNNIKINGSDETQDFIKFRFRDIVNNKFIIFRAILEGISDTITPEYAEDRYIGRPDKLYIYQGVDRSVSFGFSIYPKTKQELPILMEKLNYLVGLCYPSYTEGERMISPFIELTMGDMFVDTPGILSSLTITVEDTTTWEIEHKLQFPHFIKAQCEFKHIGNYIPATKGKHYDLDWIEGDGAAGLSETIQSTDGVNVYTDKSELGFPLYPERDATWRENVFAQLGQEKSGVEQ